MGVTSAVPEHLARFATGTVSAREGAVSTTGGVYALEGEVLAGCGGYGVSSSVLGSLWSLWSVMQENEQFVDVIHDQLITADVSGAVSVTVDDGVVSKALSTAGVATAPVAVTVAASELYGVPQTSGFVDDPVCAANGNFVHGETDVTFPGRAASLNVVRMYNSLATRTVGGFGPGWSSIVDARLSFPVFGEIRASLVDGAVVSFRPDGTGRWVPTGRRAIYVVADGDGWVMVENPSTRWSFTADGVFTGGTAGAGQVTVTRDIDGRVVQVTETVSGRFVEYRWDSARVVEVVASDGRRVGYRYDDNGVLVSVAGVGGTVGYGVDGVLLVSAMDADGVVLFDNVFDGDGRVLRQTSPFGRVTDYRYEGLSTVIIDQHGVRNAMVHDRDGNLTAVVDGDGSTMRLIYDDAGRVTRLTDRVGNVWRYEFDQLSGDLLRRVDPDGLSATWLWDREQRLVAETDRAGNTTVYEYDGMFRTPVAVVGPDGARASAVLDAHGLPVSVTDPDGVTVGFVWDTDGQLTGIVSAAGTPVRFEYDPSGFVVRMVDAGGVVTVLERDPAKRVLRTIKPETVTSYHYTPAGRVDSGIEAGDIPWSATFGTHGKLASISDATGSTARFGYDVCGNIVTVTAPDDGVYVSEYDAVGRLTRTIMPSGAVTTKRYDANGVAVGYIDAEGRTWNRDVDVFGRTIRSVAPDGSTTQWTFHPNGEIATVTGPDSRVWRTEIDAYGREIAVIDPAGRRVENRYSPAGRLIERRSPTGRSERYEYDPAGRCSAVTGVDGIRIDVTVDLRGRLTGLATDNTTLHYQRDTNGFVTHISTGSTSQPASNSVSGSASDSISDSASGVFGSSSTVIGRDSAGRITSITDAAGVGRSFRWDDRGMLASATDAAGGVTAYGYDTRGRLVSETTPAGAVGDYRYDSDGRIEAFSDPAGGITTLLRDPTGIITGSRAGDGAGWDATLDANGRQTARVGTDGSLLASFGYDLAGRITAIGGGGLSLGFMWDETDQLVATTTPAGTRQIERDIDGTVTATIDEQGRRVEFRRDEHGHIRVIFDTEHGDLDIPEDLDNGDMQRDAGGRLLVDEHGDAYRYDHAGRLIEILPANGTPATILTYDTNGLLNSETVGPRTRHFDYDPVGRLTLVDEAGAGLTEYGYDPAGRRNREIHPDGTIVTYHWDTAGRLTEIGTTRNSHTDTTTLTYDGLGRVATIADTPIGYDPATGLADRVAGTRVIHAGRHTYTTTGWDTTASVTLTNGVGQPLGSTGSRGTVVMLGGMHYGLGVDRVRILGARIYDPTTRQFLSPDPLPPAPGSNGAASGYTYAWNDPVNYLDPSGLRPLSDAEYDQIRKKEEQGRLGQAWQAIKDDPWGTLAMVAVVTVGVALVVATGGAAAAIGVGILVGAGASAGIGVATGTFSPTGVAINGVIGGLTAGAVSGMTGATSALATTLPRTIAVNAAVQGSAGMGTSMVSQLVTGDHHIDVGQVFQAGAIGAATGAATTGAGAILEKIHLPAEPLPGPGAPTTTSVRSVVETADESTTAVIGRQFDTAVAKDWAGHEILDLPGNQWTLAKNDQWVQSVVDRKMPVYVGSNTTWPNLWDAAAGRTTVFGREIKQFLDAGYTWDKWTLLPPGGG